MPAKLDISTFRVTLTTYVLYGLLDNTTDECKSATSAKGTYIFKNFQEVKRNVLTYVDSRTTYHQQLLGKPRQKHWASEARIRLTLAHKSCHYKVK